MRRCATPLHEAGLDEQLRQVLTDHGAGRAHHEVQDDLPALHGVLIQTFDVSCMAIGTQSAAFVRPGLDPGRGHTTRMSFRRLETWFREQRSSSRTDPPNRAFLSLSLKTGFKVYPHRPPCSCWLCQRRSPLRTETHSSWSLPGDTAGPLSSTGFKHLRQVKLFLHTEAQDDN